MEHLVSRERLALWKRAFEHGGFGVLPLLATAFCVQLAVGVHAFAVDFDHGPWVAGSRLLAGQGPYVGPHSALLASGSPFVYPAAAALLAVPFALLPHGAADAVFTALNMVAVLLTLRVLRVRDWRLYGLVFLWPAVISGWQTANLTLLLGLGIALVWRYRDRPIVSGSVFALLVSVKVLVWPLGIWLLATRRYAALGCAVVSGLAINLFAWGVLGFDQIGAYMSLMRALTRVQERRGYSVLALAVDHGISRAAAYALAVAIAALVGLTCVVLGRQGRDRGAFALGVGGCLLASPIVWLHYFALLIVPLALARPRLAAIWFLPLLMFFPASTPAPWQVLASLVIGALIVGAAVAEARGAQPAVRSRVTVLGGDVAAP